MPNKAIKDIIKKHGLTKILTGLAEVIEARLAELPESSNDYGYLLSLWGDLRSTATRYANRKLVNHFGLMELADAKAKHTPLAMLEELASLTLYDLMLEGAEEYPYESEAVRNHLAPKRRLKLQDILEPVE